MRYKSAGASSPGNIIAAIRSGTSHGAGHYSSMLGRITCCRCEQIKSRKGAHRRGLLWVCAECFGAQHAPDVFGVGGDG